MKKYIVVLLLVVSIANTKAQTKTAPVKKPATTTVAVSINPLKTLKDSASYALGVNIAKNMKAQNLSSLNLTLLQKGLSDVLQNKKIAISEEASNTCVTNFIQVMSNEKLVANKEIGKKFLEANAKRKGVVTLADGLQYEILKTGTDTTKPKLTEKVKCHYHGTLIDGTVFDSSVDRGEPVTFPLDGVIKGWQEAVQLMTVGSKWKLFLPSALAYGDNPAGPKIGPGSTLIFEVELLAIEK
jgi:FKBP-type peptidyl-prolyl cis-trans isomerase FklB